MRVPLVGTVKDTIDALLPLITVRTDTGHLDRMTGHYRRARARLDRLAADRGNQSPLHPQYVAATVDRLAADDAIFTFDVGTPSIWAARYLRMNGARRLIGSFNHGSMANALPHAIGAQASQPGRQVVALSGDGGIAMLLGELLTLRQMQLPVKIVIFNNGALSFVELEMKAGGIPTYGTDLDNPDFAGMARAAGLYGERVDKADQLEDALMEAFIHAARRWSTWPPPARRCRCRPRSPSARSRVSPSTQPGPSFPAEAASSSNSPGPTCGSSISNERKRDSRPEH